MGFSCGKTANQLLRAVARGDLTTVLRIVRRKGAAAFGVCGPDGCTPLLLACKKGHLQVVRGLLDAGASLADKDKDPKRQGNALHYAAWGGHESLVEFLLECGASLDDVDVVGNTPLLYAMYGGHKHIVENLLRRGRSLREKNNKNHTVILQAACGGHLELVAWLLDQGFSIDETDNDGNTSLLFAAWGGHRDLMAFLLSRGATLQEKNHNGHSVFLSAANGGRVEVVEWLLSQGFALSETNNNGDTALLLAAYGGHQRLVERLLELGATLEDKNGCGFTPLLSAANGGQLEMAGWLLDQGADLKESDNDGYTSLILAACGGNIELVSFFLRRGASLSERNNNGDTALLLAAYCGHRDLVRWLLDNGSSLQEKNNTGMGVLISAANGGHLDVVQLLLHRLGGSGLEETDEGGYTPLLLAAQRGHLKVVQYLAAFGANLHARTTRHDNDAIALAVDCPDVQAYLAHVWGFSPLQIAIDARLVDVVHQQLLAGVDPASVKPGVLQLCAEVGSYPDAPAPSVELTSLVRYSLRSWCPTTHGIFSEPYQASVMKVLGVQHVLENDFSLPRLPPEIWLHIASFTDRSWFQPQFNPARPWALSQTHTASSRRQWRQRKLFLRDVEEVFSDESDLEEEVQDASATALLHNLVLDDMELDNLVAEHNASSGRITPQPQHQMQDPEYSLAKDAENSALAAAAESQLQLAYRVTWV